MDSDADYPALLMANYLFGSGGSSRLWTRIRESGGLSYDVRSGVDWNPDEPNSSWTVSAIFAPQNQAKVEAALREELARSVKEGFTQKELDEAPGGLLNLRGWRGPGRQASPAARLPTSASAAPSPSPSASTRRSSAEPRSGQRRLAQVHRSGAGRARLGRRLQGGAVGGARYSRGRAPKRAGTCARGRRR
jgi:hypothetical protein